MSNRRISLESIAERLRGQLSPTLGLNRIGSSLDFDFLETVGNPDYWPAVWVGAQRSTPIDTGRGFSQRVRQQVSVEIAIRVIVQRYATGEQAQEDELNRICDAVADELIGWTPTGGAEPLVWISSQDGQPEQSVMTADLIFKTTVSYQYAAAVA